MDRFSPGSIVESTHWMVLHRPVEMARLTGKVPPSTQWSYGHVFERIEFISKEWSRCIALHAKKNVKSTTNLLQCGVFVRWEGLTRELLI